MAPFLGARPSNAAGAAAAQFAKVSKPKPSARAAAHNAGSQSSFAPASVPGAARTKSPRAGAFDDGAQGACPDLRGNQLHDATVVGDRGTAAGRDPDIPRATERTKIDGRRRSRGSAHWTVWARGLRGADRGTAAGARRGYSEGDRTTSTSADDRAGELTRSSRGGPRRRRGARRGYSESKGSRAGARRHHRQVAAPQRLPERPSVRLVANGRVHFEHRRLGGHELLRGR